MVVLLIRIPATELLGRMLSLLFGLVVGFREDKEAASITRRVRGFRREALAAPARIVHPAVFRKLEPAKILKDFC